MATFTGTSDFSTAYQRLNEAQKAAVDTIEGPVMVMAGPGTGKTQILTLRIANILARTDTPPDAILALTYTNSGVAAMRERLRDFIGQQAYRVNIHTFHGYASSVIEAHPTAFPRIIGASAADDVDLHDVARAAIAEVGADVLRPSGDPEYYVRPLISLIATLKSDGVSPDEYETYLATLTGDEDAYDEEGEPKAKLLRSAAFIDAYRAYERIMRERKLYDYSDMLVEVSKVLETNDELRLELAESAQYILADEHQDANRTQNRVLELLASAHPDGDEMPNLFIVGDDKQAIYRFQGASLANFLFFSERFTRAVTIPLTDNYRSTARILAAAGKLMEGRSLPAELRPTQGDGEAFQLIAADSHEDEVEAIVDSIAGHIERGVLPREIAVLVRKNRDIDAFARALRARKIPYVSHRDRDALATPEITLLIALIRAAVDPHDEDSLARALFLPAFDIPTDDLARIFRARSRGTALIEILRDDPRGARAYAFFADTMKSAHTEGAITALDRVVTGSGFLGEIMDANDMSSALAAYRSVRALIETRSGRDERYTLRDACALITDLERGIARITIPRDGGGEGVALMSLHRSKGLEFDHVYLPHALESRFKPRADRALFFVPPAVNQMEPDWDDERRLFYVGITRARKSVCASYHRLRGDEKEEKPLPFLEEVGDVMFTEATKRAPRPPEHPRVTIDEVRTEYRTVVDAFLTSGISATALNSYLVDPWECFFKNIVRLPETKAPHQMYGTAIHAALESLYRELRDGGSPDLAYLISAFESALSREPVPKRERVTYLEKGREALTGYFEAYNGTWNPHAQTEVALAVDLPLPPGHEREHVHIRGFLDRMEVDGGVANVFDYKTGRVKSRNEILGTTASSDGSIYRQLVFYKLLLDLDQRYTLGEAVIDFVEPNPRGKYKRETFSIEDEAEQELINDIARMTDDLVRGDLLKRPSNSEDANIRGLAEAVRRRFGTA